MNMDHGGSISSLKQAAQGTLSRGRRLAIRTAIACVVGASAMGVGWLHGQFLPNFAPRDTGQAVFVRDSAVAVEKFALAGRMERLHEWDKAGDVYQDLLKNFADKVYPLPQTREGPFTPYPKYTSVANEALARLVKWPADAIAIYRNRYEGEAAAVFESAHDDLTQLHHVMARYFITETGKRTAAHLMDLYLENGEFSGASTIGDQMLDRYPDLNDEERSKFLYRTSLAHHFAGNDGRAQTLLTQLTEKFPQAHANVRGEDVILSQLLAKQIADGAENRMQAYMTDTWPTLAGSPERSRVPESTNFGGARLFGVDIPTSTVRTGSTDARRQLEELGRAQMARGYSTGVFPVVDRGELFFQDNARIFALSLESGLPLSGWAQTYDGDRNGRYTLQNAWALPSSHQNCLTVTDDRVLAIMGQLDVASLPVTGLLGVRDSRLVCLDRETGEQKWIFSPKSLPAEVSSLRSLDLGGSPLAVGDTVYVQGHAGRGMQFEDFYVLALNIADGKFKWASFIVSANSEINFFNGSELGAVFAQAASHLAYSGGRVYALSNLGAVAAIDAYDGTVDWLNIYPREAQDPNMTRGLRGWRGNRTIERDQYVKPWTSNPVMVSQGKVFVLPGDGLYVHVYDAVTGAEFRRISRATFDSADTMLGIVDDKLILNSDDTVFCVNWQKYDASKNAQANEWWESVKLQRSGVPGGDSIHGRGFVTSQSVIIPTKWQLYQFSLKSGTVTQTYPAAQASSWGEEEGPGNVLVTQDRLIVAGPAGPAGRPTMRVNVYTDIAMAMTKLDMAVAAAPNDAAPRLRYAEVMFAGGKIDIAIAKLDEAIKLLSGPSRGGGAGVRDRIFSAAMTFAQKLAKENHPEQADLVSSVFERAGMAASTPSQKVNYRLSRAQYTRQMNQPDQEIKLYQQILSDPEMRGVSVGYSNGTVVAAGDLARREIDGVISRAGQVPYAPFERAAADMMLTASKGINPDQLQAVAQIYPNSTAASRALLLAAEIYESNNNPRAAVQVLRQAQLRYSGGADGHRIIEGLARNYLKLPGRIDVAIARLMQASPPPGNNAAAAEQPRLIRALTLPDGRKIDNATFVEAADQLKKFRATQAAKVLPDIGLPTDQNNRMDTNPFLPEAANSVIPDVDSLLVPVSQFSRFDRIVTFTPAIGLRVFTPGNPEPLITNAESFNEPSHEPDSCAWIGQNLLVWSDTAIVCFADHGNQPLWRKSIKDFPALELINRAGPPTDSTPSPQKQNQPGNNIVNLQVQPGGAAVIQGNRIGAGNFQIIRNANGQLVPVQIQPQQPQPSQPAVAPGAEEISTVRILSDRIIVGLTDGRVLAVALDAGRILWQTRVADRAANHLLASEDFIVVHTNDESGNAAQVTVFDVDSGQVLSRTAFGVDSSVPSLPVNMALSSDGMLIVALPNQILGKDLFTPGGLEKGSFGPITLGFSAGLLPFNNSTTPDHLQIMQDRFVIVSSENSTPAIRIYDLHTGALVQEKIQLDPAPSPLAASYLSRFVDQHFYLAFQSGVRGIDLGTKAVWRGAFGSGSTPSLRNMVVTKNHLVVVTAPGNPGGGPSISMQVFAYSRLMSGSGESGRLDFNPKVSDITGIANCQLVDGGLCYVSGDRKLHFLRGKAAK